MDLADPWPLNPHGELLLGVKIESLEGVSNVEQILSVPGIGFAEMGPGDLGLVLGYKQVPREPYPPEMQDARERVFAACRARGIAFLETCTENIVRKIDEGVRVIAGHREETARGRPRPYAAYHARVEQHGYCTTGDLTYSRMEEAACQHLIRLIPHNTLAVPSWSS